MYSHNLTLSTFSD